MCSCAMEMNRASAARQSGCSTAHAACVLRVMVGIVLAMSLLFLIEAVVHDRLCLPAGIATLSVWILPVFFPSRTERHNR